MIFKFSIFNHFSTQTVRKIYNNAIKLNKNHDENKINFPSVVYYASVYWFGIIGIFYGLSLQYKFSTCLIMLIQYILSGLGITVGAHRLFSHKSFKANKKLRALLLFFFTLTMQNSILTWVRDHRVHHKYTDTNADPHNSKRGLFFSHIGWLLCDKHSEVIKCQQRIDMRDLEADPMVMFQHKFYIPLHVIFGMVLPIALCVWMGEDLKLVWYADCCRSFSVLNSTCNLASVAHMWGMKPFDKYEFYYLIF